MPDENTKSSVEEHKSSQDLNEGEWVDVTSSNLVAVKYNDGVLSVMFHQGKVYQYPSSEAVYRGLLAAPSKGKYFRKVVEGR